MDQIINTSDVKNGTIGGTLLVFFANINSSELLKTVLMAAVGAAVSFSVSFLLKLITDFARKEKRQENHPK